MRQLKQTLLLAVLMLMKGISASAYDFEANGLYFNYLNGVNGSSVSLTYQDWYNNGYSGNITIPAKVTYGGHNYDVTQIGDYTFVNTFSNISKVTIPLSVTSIGHHAFSGCSGLTSITIPNGIISIEWATFYECSQLSSITIPNSVKSIGESAFGGCTALYSVTFGNSVESIGDDAFNNCNNLYSVSIPNSVKSIGHRAFYGCSNMYNLSIGNSVTSIGICAFENCNTLYSVTMGSSAASIDDSAFYGCEGLYDVKITDLASWCGMRFKSSYSNPLSYARRLIYNDQEISSLEVPNTVTTIGNYVFSNYAKLTSVTIGASVRSIGNAAFSGCIGISTLTFLGAVETIGDYAFQGCSNLKSATLPNTVTSIGSGAFAYCKSLTAFNIPSSVTSIGSRPLGGCSGLTSITVESGNTAYNSSDNCNVIIDTKTGHLLAGCRNSTIPAGVTSIGERAFESCKGLTSVDFPNSVIEIGSYAFAWCSDLSSVTMSSSLQSIGEYAFTGTPWYNNQPEGLFYAGNVLCGYKGTMPEGTNVTVKDGTTGIAERAFESCKGLSSISIPNSLKSIGIWAFYGCSNLTTINIPNSVTSIGNGAFWNCSSLSSVNIPNSVSSIETCTFQGCSYLTTITVPNSVETIANQAFKECTYLSSVTIGNSVKSIGGWAFDDCPYLSSVTVMSKTPPTIESSTFSNAAGATLYVPFGSKTAYDVADYWKAFKEIVEIAAPSPVIEFADATVKALCVAKWDTDGDGELSEDEAAAVKELENVFLRKTIKSFDELRYFTGLTSIGYSAFSECSSLSSLTIPKSVTSIGSYAFQKCVGLNTIILPSTVTSIGVSTFNGCSQLSSIDLSHVEHIGNQAFSGCSKLASIDFNDRIGDIGAYAFSNTEWLAQQPEGLLYIGRCLYTYKGQIPLNQTIVIDEGTTNIAGRAFENQGSLTSVIIPQSIQSIGDYAFTGCACDVTIKNDVPIKIESTTFPNSKNQTLYVPYGSKATYQTANYWNVFKKIVELPAPSPLIEFADANVKALCVAKWDTDGDGELSEDEAAAVTALDGAFMQKENIKSFDEFQYFTGVTAIGIHAFLDCSSLTSVTIPANVTSIADDAFFGCSSLASITIPTGVTSIGKAAFTDCGSLTSITVADGNTIYDSRENCNAIIHTKTNNLIAGCQNTVIPNNIATIGYYAFGHCKKLSTIDIPNSVTVIEEGAFSGCSSLTSVSMSDNVKSIGGFAFNFCDLTSIIIPATASAIGEYAFGHCDHLSSVTVMTNTPVSIESTTFSNRTNATLYVPAGSKVAYEAADYWKEFKEIVETSDDTFLANTDDGVEMRFTIVSDENKTCMVGPGISGEGNNRPAIDGATEKVTIPSVANGYAVVGIGDYAFGLCTELVSIVIPQSIVTIGNAAFNSCYNLSTVTIMVDKPIAINSSTFGNCPKDKLYVPTGCKAAYEAADYWKEFKEIVEIRSLELVNTIAADDVQGNRGNQVSLNVNLTNEDEVKLCQFDLCLPTGVTVATKSNGKLDAKLTERAETHSISSKQLENGNYRFIISSLDNDAFTGNSGTLVEITLDIPATMEAGEYTIKLLNAELSVPDGNDLKVVKPADTESKLTVKAYTSGDVNNDGSVSVTDVGCAINYILEQVPSVFVFEAADMNGDKSVSVTDVGMIINLILNEGAAASPQMNRAAAENAQLSMLSTTEGYQLQLGNKDVFIGFQMDVQVANSAAINDMKLMGGDDHLMTYRQLSNGMYRVVCYSPMNNTFVANDAALLNIAADGNVTISNVRLTTAGLSEVYIDGISAGTTGITDVKGLQGDELKVYSLDGRLCRTISKESGENPLSGLKAGVYMIGNRKVVVR